MICAFSQVYSDSWESPALDLVFNWEDARRINLGMTTSEVDSMLRNPEKVSNVDLSLKVEGSAISAGLSLAEGRAYYVFWQIIHNVGLNIYLEISPLKQEGKDPLDIDMVISGVAPVIQADGTVTLNSASTDTARGKIGRYEPTNAAGVAGCVKLESVNVVSDMSNISGEYVATMTIIASVE